jgi:sugar transferase (PEP-CTERM/EpsH1 system associated)
MKILYLAHRIPYPPNKGDKIRSFHEIKHLSGSHGIDLICLADKVEDLRHQNDLKQYCRKVFVAPVNKTPATLKGLAYLAKGKPLSVGYFYSKKVQETFDRWFHNTDYDAIICFSSPMAEYIFRSKYYWTGKTQGTRHKVQGKDDNSGYYNQKRKRNGYLPYNAQPPNDSSTTTHYVPNSEFRTPKLIMDFCDVDSDKWRQYAQRSSFPKSLLYNLENIRLAAYEQKIAEHFNYSVFVSEKEGERFKQQNPHITNLRVISNGVDYEHFSPGQRHKVQGVGSKETSFKTFHPEPCTLHPVLMFSGAMDYHANVDGIIWFCKEILPKIRLVIPRIQLYVVGSNPTRHVQKLGRHDGIKVTGFVEDVRKYYQMADVCLAPLRIARGVQNKILEAMAMGKPIVSTSMAVQGIDAVNCEQLLVADNPKDFAQVVLRLLSDDEMRRELGSKARQFVKLYYDWRTNLMKLDQLITRSSQSPESKP